MNEPGSFVIDSFIARHKSLFAIVIVLTPLFSLVGKTFPLLKAQVKAMKRGSAVDFSKAKEELGLPFTPLEKDFATTLDWYQSNGFIKS